jgi:hypothetical protein
MKKIEPLKITRNEYAEALMQGVYELAFQKKDGSLRVMYCTLIPDLIPKTPQEIEKHFFALARRKTSEKTLSVYDLQTAAWRSFRTDAVVTFNKIKVKVKV